MKIIFDECTTAIYSEKTQRSLSALENNYTETDHSMSDAQANNTQFDNAQHKGETSQ